MKIAVTGATGFIGRHVLAELTRRRLTAVAVVRDATVAPTMPDGVEVVSFDLDRPQLDPFRVLGCPDAVIHLAWGGLPNYRSLHHFEHELPTQYRFLAGLVRGGLRSLVVTGTCFEYGMQSGELTEERVAPDNPYGFAKDALRRQLDFLRSSHPFALSWPRLFYLHGEGQSATSLWPQLHSAVEQGRSCFKMSGGEQLRDYLPVTEVARCLVVLASNQADVGAINVCAGRPVSVRSLVESWIKGNGWAIDLDLGCFPYPDYEPMAFWGSRQKLDRFLASLP